MWFKRYRDRLGLLPILKMSLRSLHYLSQYIAVRTMDPIEVADAHKRAAKIARHFVEFVEDKHPKQLALGS
jgi:hypothetical protein